MKKLILIVVLITVLLGSFVAITKTANGATEASATVDVMIIIDDYIEVTFEDAAALEVHLRYRQGAKAFGRKKVLISANFVHNIETIVLDNPGDGIILTKAPGTTADRTNVRPGSKRYNVRVKATLQDKTLVPSGTFVAGTVTVTVTKVF